MFQEILGYLEDVMKVMGGAAGAAALGFLYKFKKAKAEHSIEEDKMQIENFKLIVSNLEEQNNRLSEEVKERDARIQELRDENEILFKENALLKAAGENTK